MHRRTKFRQNQAELLQFQHFQDGSRMPCGILQEIDLDCSAISRIPFSIDVPNMVQIF